MNARIVPLILSGGNGTRLWPVSRDALPKQFLPLVGATSTFQAALARVSDRDLFDDPVVITHAEFRFFAAEQARSSGRQATILLEPERRDSAAAIAAAATYVQQTRPGAVVLALASDHVIGDVDLFLGACATARGAAERGRIVTFGIRPSLPKTSYGYIRPGASLGPGDIYEAASFVEKPDASTAALYVADGYLWNSGNFMFPVDVMVGELGCFAPEVLDPAALAASKAVRDLDFVRLDAGAFNRAARVSIDYAVMEKTRRAAVVLAKFQWSDIGCWDAVGAMSLADESGNVLRGPVEVVDARNVLAHSEGSLVAIVGVDNLVVVATRDAVLVLDRRRSEEVKPLVARLKQAGRREAVDHRVVPRPWGKYETIDTGERFQVKHITVSPGKRLSLQKHMHRAEHWVVVRGIAEVTINARTRVVHENESIRVPLGATHRLGNPGKIPLELIEVQSGSYLGEDDVIRLRDDFDRS